MTRLLVPPDEGEVVCVDGFLGANQCAELLDDLEYAWWWTSLLVRQRPDGTLVSGTSRMRTSMTTSEDWLSGRSRSLLRRIEGRLAQRLGIKPDHLEMWQATRYRRGDHFSEHHDAGFFGADSSGERTTTFLVYLDGQRGGGGGTVFPLLGRRFHPLPGRLLVWNNLHADGCVDDRMRHEARPARAKKTTLTTWARQHPIRVTENREEPACPD